MNRFDDTHNFYNSENDGYRWGLGGYQDPLPEKPKQEPKASAPAPRRGLALILACLIAGGGAGAGGAALYLNLADTGPGSAQVYESQRPKMETVSVPGTAAALSPAQLYAASVDSCVGITVTTQRNYFGQLSSSAASGSGFVLTEDGYVVTNYHVVEAAARTPGTPITVSFHNGDSYEATLVGYEAENDVALLKIQAQGLLPVLLGDSANLVIGEPVMAIGNPLGELDYSITDGIVSALDRLITDNEGQTFNMLQTNCAINPGNSGGPLFNQYGEVIGITTAKYTNSTSGTTVEGLGFAIPINDVKQILGDLMEFGYVTGKPYMGVTVSNVPELALRYGVVAGAAIETVTEGSAAQKAGLEPGDIIVAVDDTAVDAASALTAALTAYRAGDTAALTVVRGGQELKLTITFDDKNQVAEQAARQPEPQQPESQQPETPQPEPQQPESANPYEDFFGQWPFYGYRQG